MSNSIRYLRKIGKPDVRIRDIPSTAAGKECNASKDSFVIQIFRFILCILFWLVYIWYVLHFTETVLNSSFNSKSVIQPDNLIFSV